MYLHDLHMLSVVVADRRATLHAQAETYRLRQDLRRPSRRSTANRWPR